MDEIIGTREAERAVIDRIEEEYGIAVRQDAAGRHTVFALRPAETQSGAAQGDGLADSGVPPAIKLISRAAAIHRNPSVSSAKHPPCMADIERVETGLLRIPFMEEGVQEENAQVRRTQRERGYQEERYREDQNEGSSHKNRINKLLSAALSYQNQLQMPLCVVENIENKKSSPKGPSVAGRSELDMETCRRFGFESIYDRPHYTLNTQTISEEMLRRAAAGEAVSISMGDAVCTLQAVAQEEMLSLAHFVNARLCRQCGFFIIRSASYYERVQRALRSSGGSLFQIMHNGVRRGCFAYTGSSEECVREAVFDSVTDRERCLLEMGGQRQAVLARIVNMPEMLRHISGSGKITIAIRLTDPVIAENDGLFIWYIDEKGSRMERVEQPSAGKAADSSMRPEVTATIGAFTAFLSAHMQLKENAKFDSIYLAGPAWLDEV